MRSWPRWKRLAFAAVVSPTLFATLASVVFYSNLHRRASAMSTASMMPYPPLESSRRLLILAPHCDDETLGAGGLIAEARRRNISVSVAFLTNGDGFPAVCALATKKVTLRSADYIHFGELRQMEALAALDRLGVSADHVHFLSYPDRGIKALWETSWPADQLYRSSYTASDHSPFSRTFTPKTAYCGESVRSDLVRLLEEIQPTDVFVTHPSDDHSDHSAAAAFTQAAVEQVKTARHIASPLLHYYIVHRGDWPLPQGLYPDKPLMPPAGLTRADTTWYTLSLSAQALRAKTEALSRYGSQMEICGRQLQSFVRENEIFGQLSEPTLVAGVAGSVRDATQDDVVRFANPSTDLTGLRVTEQPDGLEIHVRLRGGIAPGVRYALRLQSDQGVYLTQPLKVPRLPKPNVLELVQRIPYTALQSKHGTRPHVVWISAETGITNRYIVDQTGYRQFHLSHKPETAE